MTDVREMAKEGVAKAQTAVAVVDDSQASKSIEETFKQIMPKLAQASLAKMPPEFIVSTAMTVLRNSEQLRKCDPLSVVHCVVQSAQTGLRLDPVLQQAALVPRWNNQKKRTEAQFMPMYRGLLLLARRSGQIVHVAAQPVYAADQFTIEYGSEQKLIHRPELNAQVRLASPILRYYAYIKLVGGGFQFEVMSQEEIDVVKAEALSDKKNKDASPWTTDPVPMALKTVLRRVLKLAPVSDPMLSAALLSDELLEQSIPQQHTIENGLVVPGASFSDDEPDSKETAGDAKIAPAPKAAEPVPIEKVDPVLTPAKTWFGTAMAVIPGLCAKGDKPKVKEWWAEALKRRDVGEITEAELAEMKQVIVKHFPPAPAPQPALFDGNGNPTVESVPTHDPAAEKAEKPAPKKKSAKKAASRVVELAEALEGTTKLSALFTLKSKIEKAELMDTERNELLAALNKKMSDIKGVKA